MQNRMASPNDVHATTYSDYQPPVAWTRDQLVRLEHEWRQLQRNFAYHPTVRIIPVQGNPPAEYTVEFKARTLHVRDDGQLDYITTPSIHIWLPPGYPHDAPVVRPINALFHPNVSMDGIVINPAWEPTRTLAQLVQQIGALVAFHTYDPWSVWNPAAMEWVAANAAYLPTDPGANFAPTAGGEPLGRICQSGQKTVDQIRGQLKALCDSLVGLDEPPSAEEVRHFAEQIRLATNLFLDDEIPDSLRGPATELDQWAETLPPVTMVFESLRQRHLAVAAARAATDKIDDSRRALQKEFDSLSAMVSAAPSSDPYAALAQLPALPGMQAAYATFKVIATEAEKRLAAARGRLAALLTPDPRMNFTHSELLEKTIDTEIERAAAEVRAAQESTSAAIEALVPVLDRAKDELAAFDRVIGWREYADLTAKAEELVGRIMEWGSAGVQAYYVENEGGAFGPFEFEQRLDLGESALAVRNTGRTSIEIFDIHSGGKLAVSETRAATVKLPGGEDGAVYKTTFRMTARCDDLWVQVEYLSRQIGELVSRLRKPVAVANAKTWVKAYVDVLGSKAALDAFVRDTKQGLLDRANLVSDLKILSRFKERMTTQFLLERHAEMIARFKKDLAEAQKNLKDSNARIADIFSKSQREVETGQPMIPPKLAKEYDTQTKRRDDSQRKIAQLNRRFATAIAQMTPRLSTPALYGSDAYPQTVMLPPLPDELLGRAQLMGELAIGQEVAALEDALSTKLRPDVPEADAPRTHGVRPSEPEAHVVAEGDAEGHAVEGDTVAFAPDSAEETNERFAIGHEEHTEETESHGDFIDFGHGGEGEQH